MMFTKSSSELSTTFAELAGRLAPAGMLWVSWPKKSSGVRTDLDENVVRNIGLDAGLVDVKVCAVTEVWSGLKFVRRLKDRPVRIANKRSEGFRPRPCRPVSREGEGVSLRQNRRVES